MYLEDLKMTDFRKLAMDIADDHIIDIEIISQAIRDLLPKETGRLLFKATNICLRNKGIRQQAFNAHQMKHGGCRFLVC